MSKESIYKLSEEIYTNSTGVNEIISVYNFFKSKENETVEICFKGLRWIDANLCALLQAVLYKLSKENNLKFIADINTLEEKFHVFFNNGFIKQNGIKQIGESSVELKTFKPSQENEFIDYIDIDLLGNHGMSEVSPETKERISDAMIELFNNYQVHAKTEYPVFACGQFFPKQEKIIFTVVDLGVGFLPAIKEKTKSNKQPVTTHLGAIKWSVKKKNTTKQPPGGLGLSDLKKCTIDYSGEIQIVTGDTFWSSSLNEDFFPFKRIHFPFVGSTINLIFSSK